MRSFATVPPPTPLEHPELPTGSLSTRGRRALPGQPEHAGEQGLSTLVDGCEERKKFAARQQLRTKF